MQSMYRVASLFLMVWSFYGEAAYATPSNNLSDEYMATFLKSIGDNEKVLYKNGKIAFLASKSKVLTTIHSLVGLTLLGAGGVTTGIALSSRRDRDLLLPGGICMLLGAGFSGYAVHRLIKHFTKESYIVLDDDGLIEWKIRKLSWQKVHKIETDSIRVYNAYGIMIATKRIVHLIDKYGNNLFHISDDEESLPIPFDNFIDVAEHYWNKNKVNE